MLRNPIMKQKIKNFISKYYFIITLFLFILCFFSLLPFFKYQTNPDGISLINISKKYLTGNFKFAINGYWSPMISLLLIPFLIIMKNGIIAFKVLSFFIGLFSIYSFDRFLKKMNLNSFFTKIFIILTIPVVIAHFSLITITSDFLSSTFYLFTLSFFIDKEYFKKNVSILIFPLIGFLTYLSKTYGFFFFLGIISFIFLYFIFKKDGKCIRNIIFIFIVFIIFSSFWIILISIKYGYFTIGTTGKYNYSLLSTDSLSLKKIYSSPLPPPDTLSTSFWDDPSFVKHPEFKIFTVKENSNYYFNLVMKKLLRTIKLFFSFTLFFPFLIFFSIVYFFKKGNRFKLAIILFASLLSFIGYLPVEMERRYIFVNFFLLSCLFLFLINSFSLRKIYKYGIFFLVLLSFLIMPVREIKSDLYANKEIFYLYEELKELNLSGNVASNKNRIDMTSLSYYLGLKYYGTFYKDYEENIFIEELNKNNISYYFYFGKDPLFLNNFKILYEKTFYGESLKIYNVK